ncbi:MAG: sulfate adenylyltransferase subunit 1 [Thermodesulfobacteriota bacterium]
MEENPLNIVIVGHVDHGKSTLIGRLFYDTGSLSPDRVEDLRRISREHGREMEFAFLMDHLSEEREKGITIDIAHTFFKTDKRRYVIIDAPGHKEFLKNMITGSSQAEAAVLLVDAASGVKDQTLRHCYMLGLLGIGQVVVVINKMDTVGYSEEKFEEVKRDITSVLKERGITPAHVIPISARLGDFVAKKTDNLAWFKGPTVLEALDGFEAASVEEKDLRFPVQDVYDVDGLKLAVGRVEAGRVKKGMAVNILPDGAKGTVTDIRKFEVEGLNEAGTGECVGIRVEGAQIKRGDILSESGDSIVTDTIHANIFWLIDKDYLPGVSLTLRCATQETRGDISRIIKRFDPATSEVWEKEAETIRPAEVAEVEIKLEKPVVIDRFSDIPELGRFVLEHAGRPVAGGIIV